MIIATIGESNIVFRPEQWTPLTRIHFGPAITVICSSLFLTDHVSYRPCCGLQITMKTTLHTRTHLLPLFGLPNLPIWLRPFPPRSLPHSPSHARLSGFASWFLVFTIFDFSVSHFLFSVSKFFVLWSCVLIKFLVYSQEERLIVY